MSENRVNDLITHQERAFVHLMLSATMTDRKAAKAAGLNPNSAAEIKAKPRVQAYMLEHRAAVEQQAIQQEAESQQPLNLERERVLTRLWEIAYLSPEMTRGSITSQVKAISMIVAIQGLIPDRRVSASKTQPMAPPMKAEIYKAEWLRNKQDQSANEQPAETVAATQAPTAAPKVPEPEPPAALDRDKQQNHPSSANNLTLPKELSWVPDTTSCIPDPVLDPASPLRQPFRLPKGPFGRYR